MSNFFSRRPGGSRYAFSMIHGRLKGQAAGLRVRCSRCGFLRIVTGGAGIAPSITSGEEEAILRGEAERYESSAPPGNGDPCPRCRGDAWSFRVTGT